MKKSFLFAISVALLTFSSAIEAFSQGLAVKSETSQGLAFKSETLANAAKAMNLQQLDTLAEGTTLIPHDSYELSVRREGDRIVHIGRHLFSADIHEVNPSPVYDYLEYAYLDHTKKLSDNPFLYKDLFFDEGDWNALSLVNDSVPFSLTSVNGKRYQVKWLLADNKAITLSFPIGYEKLSMMSRRELERNFISELKNYKPGKAPRYDYSDSLLVDVDSVVCYMPGDHYMIDEINDRCYYQREANGEISPLWNQSYPCESLANLFHWGLLKSSGLKLSIRFKLYENKSDSAIVAIDQLLAYGIATGCRVFWGMEGVNEGIVCGTLMLVNDNSAYNHVLSIACPVEALFAEEGVLAAEASLFIPTQNIRNLYFQSEGKKKHIQFE